MAKYLPHGTKVSIGGTDIGGLVGVTLPDEQKGSAETTDSASGGDRTFEPALRDPGSMTLTMRHDPDDTGQQALRTNYEGDANEEIIITLPSDATSASGSETWTFDGHVTSPPSGDLDLVGNEKAEVSCEVKLSGSNTVA